MKGEREIAIVRRQASLHSPKARGVYEGVGLGAVPGVQRGRLPVSLHQQPQPKGLTLAGKVVEGYCLFVYLPMLINV